MLPREETEESIPEVVSGKEVIPRRERLKPDMSNREFHPASMLFPMMTDEELQELAADIKANGQQQAIELLDKKIIDGRNRYLACGIAHVTPRVVQIKGVKDPVAYVLSKNLYRRHLTTSQKAMIAAKAKEYHEEQAKARMAAGGGDKRSPTARGSGKENLPYPVGMTPEERQESMQTDGGIEPEERQADVTEPVTSCQGQSRDLAGKALGVSGKTVDMATKVLTEGTPEDIKAVETGKATVSAKAKAIKQRKQVKAKKETSDAPVDADGQIIPERLQGVFAAADDYEKIANTLAHLKGVLTKAVEDCPDAWDNHHVQVWTGKFRMTRHEIEQAKPYIVCPDCPGRAHGHCHGRGWLTQPSARSILEIRNPRRLAAGLDPVKPSHDRLTEATVPASKETTNEG